MPINKKRKTRLIRADDSLDIQLKDYAELFTSELGRDVPKTEVSAWIARFLKGNKKVRKKLRELEC